MEEREQFKALPDVNVLKIGGQSVTDMGAKAVVPVLEEIVQNAREHKIIISTGGGTCSRHVYSIALELGMPTGVIAKLGQSVSEQNALMISTLLMPHGGSRSGTMTYPNWRPIFLRAASRLFTVCPLTGIGNTSLHRADCPPIVPM